ncbi:hypothetical protein OsI_10839 [Oryza sativa Indica Group]|uniref:ARG1 protein n=2 Tax=Oryza sativa TaxID=4530 RepID=Q84Q99_ORYSJ|nr:putative ARG1 protein [Oryza sativa Japonica Group]EAY89336.1 hypothetical protein OsI_10839 [Oryza sativa Indica Group]EAZ26342.1 hypothetical protein OsJ_10223 [Oryza sativa Japonica Group]
MSSLPFFLPLLSLLPHLVAAPPRAGRARRPSEPAQADKKCALFYGVTISEEQARSGIVVRVNSAAQSEFKLLFFEQEFDGGYGLALQVPRFNARVRVLSQASWTTPSP